MPVCANGIPYETRGLPMPFGFGVPLVPVSPPCGHDFVNQPTLLYSFALALRPQHFAVWLVPSPSMRPAFTSLSTPLFFGSSARSLGASPQGDQDMARELRAMCTVSRPDTPLQLSHQGGGVHPSGTQRPDPGVWLRASFTLSMNSGPDPETR